LVAAGAAVIATLRTIAIASVILCIMSAPQDLSLRSDVSCYGRRPMIALIIPGSNSRCRHAGDWPKTARCRIAMQISLVTVADPPL